MAGGTMRSLSEVLGSTVEPTITKILVSDEDLWKNLELLSASEVDAEFLEG